MRLARVCCLACVCANLVFRGVQASTYTDSVVSRLACPEKMPYENSKPVKFTCPERNSDKKCLFTYLVEGIPTEQFISSIKDWQNASNGAHLILVASSTPLDVHVICHNQTGHIMEVFHLSKNDSYACPPSPCFDHIICEADGTHDCKWYLNDTRILPNYTEMILVPGLQLPAQDGVYSCSCGTDGTHGASVHGEFTVKFTEPVMQGTCSRVTHSEVVKTLVKHTDMQVDPINEGLESSAPTQPKENCTHGVSTQTLTISIVGSIVVTALVTASLIYLVSKKRRNGHDQHNVREPLTGGGRCLDVIEVVPL